MAERDMSGKVLLDKLYGGLNTMPAGEAARDFRRLNDDFLGKPAEMTATGEFAAAPSRTDNTRSTSRPRILRSSLVVLCLVAVAGTIAAAVLRDSDKRVAALPPAPAAIPVPMPAPLEQTAEVAPSPPAEPVVLVNPFDKTEKFTFPPGTSKAEAREQMADLLMQRALERGANRPRARSKMASEPRKPSNAHGS